MADTKYVTLIEGRLWTAKDLKELNGSSPKRSLRLIKLHAAGKITDKEFFEKPYKIHTKRIKVGIKNYTYKELCEITGFSRTRIYVKVQRYLKGLITAEELLSEKVVDVMWEIRFKN